MPSSLYCTAVGFLVVATIHVSAQQPGTRITPGKILPGTGQSVSTAIQGNALTSTNAPLTNASARLRDARSGQIVGTQTTDRSGLFSFPAVDPGSYVVEIMGEDQYTVLAASQILNVGSGEAVSAIVKLPFKTPPFHGLLGKSTASAAAVTALAASAGVLAIQASGAATCDTLQR